MIKPHSEILTIMFIDIVNYTKTTSRLSRESFNQLHEAFDNLSLPIFEQYQGKVIKKIGDAFMITFKTATDAVICGIELQNSFKTYNKKYKPKIPLLIRVALHSGEVIIRNNDVYGEAVNVAARIEGITKANDIVFSEAVYSAMNKSEIPYLHIGRKKLKGVRIPLRLFKVKNQKDKLIKLKKVRSRFVKKTIINLLIVILLGIIIYMILWYLANYSTIF